jgi:hypothetical protein
MSAGDASHRRRFFARGAVKLWRIFAQIHPFVLFLMPKCRRYDVFFSHFH